MSNYLTALEKHGYRIRFNANGTMRITPQPAPNIRSRVLERLFDIQAELLARRGYVLIDSRLLGETIAIGPGPYPAGVVGYTLDECRYLMCLWPAELQAIHKIKREVPGARVEGYPQVTADAATNPKAREFYERSLARLQGRGR